MFKRFRLLIGGAIFTTFISQLIGGGAGLLIGLMGWSYSALTLYFIVFIGIFLSTFYLAKYSSLNVRIIDGALIGLLVAVTNIFVQSEALYETYKYGLLSILFMVISASLNQMLAGMMGVLIAKRFVKKNSNYS